MNDVLVVGVFTGVAVAAAAAGITTLVVGRRRVLERRRTLRACTGAAPDQDYERARSASADPGSGQPRVSRRTARVLALAAGAITALAGARLLASWFGVIAGIIAVRATWLRLGRHDKERSRALARQRPDVLRTIGDLIGGGAPFQAAIGGAATYSPEPSRGALLEAAADLLAGRPVESAFDRMCDDSREGRLVHRGLVEASSLGSGGGSLLSSIAGALEHAREEREEANAVMAPALVSAYVAPGVGVATLVVLERLSPGAVEALPTSPAGLAALLVASALYGVAFVSIRRAARGVA